MHPKVAERATQGACRAGCVQRSGGRPNCYQIVMHLGWRFTLCAPVLRRHAAFCRASTLGVLGLPPLPACGLSGGRSGRSHHPPDRPRPPLPVHSGP